MSNPYAPPGSRPPGDQPRAPDQHQPAGPGSEQRPPQQPPWRQGDGHRAPAPARPPVGPEQRVAALRTCRDFVLLVLAGLVVLPLRLPWQVASLGFFVVGGVYGVLALTRVARARIRQGVVGALVLGLVGTTLLGVAELSQVAAWKATMADQRCRDRALTISAQQACARDYHDSLERLVDSGR